MSNVQFHVVGLRHHVTKMTMVEIARACPIKVAIRREPENQHDPNALKVVCLASPWRNMHLGYLSRGVAEVWAEWLDSRRIEIKSAVLTEIDTDEGVGTVDLKIRHN